MQYEEIGIRVINLDSTRNITIQDDFSINVFYRQYITYFSR